MESFYGGKQGISFNIIAHFDCIDADVAPNKFGGDYYAVDENGTFLKENNKYIAKTTENQFSGYKWQYRLHDGKDGFPKVALKGMKQCFMQGGLTTSEVGYGEYVIIDTIVNCHNSSHEDNGKIYRRGMNYQESETGGAEYIGQVIGTKGQMTEFSVDKLDTVRNHNISNSPFYGKYTVDNKDLVAGRADGNDAIEYAWANIVDETGDVVGAKIGFKFPYLVVNFTATKVDPYATNFLTQTRDKPFNKQWDIKVPQGIHGIDSKNFKIESDSLYEENGKGQSVWYDEVDYTNKTPVTTRKKVGEIDWVNEAQISADGTIQFTNTAGTVVEKQSKYLKVVKNMEILTGETEGSGNQKLKVTYNTGAIQEIGNPINYIMESIVTKEDALSYGTNPYHLLVLYADPSKRGNVSYPSKLAGGVVRNDWIDLGYIRGEIGGLKIVGDVNSITDLQNKTPEQVLGSAWKDDYIGWAITVESKYIYIYDYTKGIWYSIGEINVPPYEYIAIATDQNQLSKLKVNGIWLVKENMQGMS